MSVSVGAESGLSPLFHKATVKVMAEAHSYQKARVGRTLLAGSFRLLAEGISYDWIANCSELAVG